mgnify:CR=1 FL=1
MSAQSDQSQLRRRAAEMILGTPDLTDELTDAEARPLLHWGLAQAEFAAEMAEVKADVDRQRAEVEERDAERDFIAELDAARANRE